MEPEDQRISVLVADDEERLRRIVEALLSAEDDIEVVGQAVNGQDAIAQAQALVPDLVLLDVRMRETNGIEAARVINRLLPTSKVVMLTASDEEEHVFEALKAGASGYLLKESLLEDLPGAIRVVAQGLGLLLSPSIANKLVTEFKDPSRPGPASGGSSLTGRELEVLRLVSLGRANHEIAEELCLSSHTVKRLVANILAKLHQRSRLDAVMHAIRNGVLAEAP